MAYSEEGCADGLQTRQSTCRRSKSPLLLSFCFLLLSLFIFGFTQHFIKALSRQLFGKRRHNIKVEVTDIVELPPLEKLIAENGTITGDISWMLDFAVIAFPKAGTTFMKDHLNSTTETYVYEREFCMKHYSDVADFVKIYYDLHAKLKQPRYPKTIQFGLKCPGVLYRADDIHIYAKYFPNTKFIVGLRHPVSWFESFYNYQSYRKVDLPTTSQLIGNCVNHQKVCTDRARFHTALARLGLTPMKDDEENSLLFGLRYDVQQTNTPKDMRNYLRKEISVLPNQVLLYEIRQIHDKEESKAVSSSIQQYLGIHEDFPAILSYKQNKTRAIDICDGEHMVARRLLVEHGTDARIWIQKYFLKHPTVEVASPGSFFQLLNDWSDDPCSNEFNTFGKSS